MKFEIIFVRHGESCANVWQERTHVGQLIYKDPELTPLGISRSNAKHSMLKEVIDKYFPSYSICSSPLLRAQQTAYHMLAKHVNKPINIIPFLSEYGITSNNVPFKKEKQAELIKKLDPELLNAVEEGKDARHHQSLFNKTSYPKFLKWAKDNLDYFKQGNDDVYRAVIFTHGKLLRNIFPLKNAIPPVKTHRKYHNNDFILTTIGDKNDYNDIPHEPHFLYFDTSNIKGESSVEDSCSSESCRIPISCKKGGTLKVRKLKPRTRRNKRRIV